MKFLAFREESSVAAALLSPLPTTGPIFDFAVVTIIGILFGEKPLHLVS